MIRAEAKRRLASTVHGARTDALSKMKCSSRLVPVRSASLLGARTCGGGQCAAHRVQQSSITLPTQAGTLASCATSRASVC